MNPSIGLYQICFNSEQLQNVPAGQLPWDNVANLRPELREYQIFREMFRTGEYKKHDLTGALSAKFPYKTNFSAEQFKQWILKNPGYDLYFVNPFPQIYCQYHDIWRQGEFHHPNFMKYTQRIFAHGFGHPEADPFNFRRSRPELWSFCNYWVATPKFWEFYIPILEKLLDFCLTDKVYPYFGETTAYPRSLPMFPMIMERWLSSVLIYPECFPGASNFKTLRYEYPKSEYLAQCMHKREQFIYKRMDKLNLQSIPAFEATFWTLNRFAGLIGVDGTYRYS